MGVGVSLLLIAAGAILTWAVSAEVSGIDLNTVGVILMVVGANRPRALACLLVELGRHGHASQGRRERPSRHDGHRRARQLRALPERPGRTRGMHNESLEVDRPEPGVVLLRANGDLDAYTAPGLRLRLHEATDGGGEVELGRRRPAADHVHRLGGPRRTGRGAQANARAGRPAANRAAAAARRARVRGDRARRGARHARRPRAGARRAIRQRFTRGRRSERACRVRRDLRRHRPRRRSRG